MGSSTTHRRRRAPAVHTGAAVLTLVLGLAAIACSSPDPVPDANAVATSSTSTSIDPGSGPTSITTSLRTTEIARGFDRPTAIANRPMRNQLWIAERAGRVRVVALAADWNLETGRSVRGGYHTYPETVLDISGDVSQSGERGVLGLAFSTDGNTVFLSWVNGRGEIVVASWSVTDPMPPPTTTVPSTPAPTVAPGSSTTTRPAPTTSTSIARSPLPDPTVQGRTRRVMLSIPREGDTNYGGHLALGRDGYLYVGVGDATQGAAVRNAQDPESLLGKILRIDPGGATMAESYSIPASNPWAKGNGAPAVFTIGVHDPLRFSFDRLNGDLWVGDSGEGSTQEIVLLSAASGAGRGANLGWPLVEGSNAPPSNAPSGIVAPIVSFESGGGNCPVIGGYVYRGQAIASLRGVYVYGDRCSGAVSGVLQRRGKLLDSKPLGPRVGNDVLIAFGQDDQGELYALLSSGVVLRFVA